VDRVQAHVDPNLVELDLDPVTSSSTCRLAVGCLAALGTALVLSACSGGGADTRGDAVEQFLAAAAADDLDDLRKVTAYPDPDDSGQVLLGAAIPAGCLDMEVSALDERVASWDTTVRYETVEHPGFTEGTDVTAPFELEMAFFEAVDGGEEGRQLMESGGNWYVVAALSEDCSGT
jgi:hypothetical protein